MLYLSLLRRRLITRLTSCIAVLLLCITIWKQAPNLSHRNPVQPRYAFATFLGDSTCYDDPSRQSQVDVGAPVRELDGYYIGVRYLNYMLRHNPSTRSRNHIPLLVLVTEEVAEYKIRQLQLEGAQVVRLDRIALPDWMQPGDPRYVDVLTKLKLWRMTEYAKICFLDADTMLVDALDGVFDDPATAAQPVDSAESGLPTSYVFAALAENYHFVHPIPPVNSTAYLNSGFFVIRPDEQLFEYYMRELFGKDEHRWGKGIFPEQDLFNSIHGWDGVAPWQQLNWRWNAHYPTYRDLQAGVRSLHDKFWEDEQEDPDFRSDTMLRTIWRNQVREMERYYRRVGRQRSTA